MSDSRELAQEAMLAISRIATEAATAPGPEEALWCITRALPGLLGESAAALAPNAFREVEPPTITTACAVFLRTPCGKHHLITAPVNFPAEQHHELVDINLGHPGHIAKTKRPMLLRDTALHASFVKIMQTFRAGSTMFTPLLWQEEYLGVIICANAARRTYGERDLAIQTAFAGLASALFMAHGGPAWLMDIDLTGLPVRSKGN
jgi:hypothetical protein